MCRSILFSIASILMTFYQLSLIVDCHQLSSKEGSKLLIPFDKNTLGIYTRDPSWIVTDDDRERVDRTKEVQMSGNQRLSFLRCELSGYQLLLTLLNFPIGMKKCLVQKRSLRKQESPLFDQEWNGLTKTNNDYESQGMKMNILGRVFGLNELKKNPPKPTNSAQRKEKVPEFEFKPEPGTSNDVLPFFGPKTFKRHDVSSSENAERYDDSFPYEPSYDGMKPDSPTIERLTPSWLTIAMASLGRHIGTPPQNIKSNSSGRQKISRLSKSRVITDRNTIMKLNFRHVLRGA